MSKKEVEDLLAQASDPNLILTPQINDYLMAHQGNIEPWAMDRVMAELKRPGRKRSGSFSASSAGECLRRQELAFLGKPQAIVYPNLQMTFQTGHWLGAQFQATLLSAGLIEDIETPLPWPRMWSMGSMDGKGFVSWQTANPKYQNREFILELKTVSGFMINDYIKNGKPKDAHMKQMTRYSLASGIDLAVYIMLDKGNITNQGWHEMVVEITDEMREESAAELAELNAARESKKLHDILPGCKIGTGTQYKYCPFTGANGVCKSTKEWK